MVTKNFQTLKSNKQGFTMIEMIISLGIFSVVILTFSSSFLSLITAERRITASISVQDNLRFALEVMAKEIRTGTGYGAGGTSFSFTNTKGDSITYELSLTCNANYKCIFKTFPRPGGGSPLTLPLTSDQISIDDLKFYVAGESPNDDFQPMVTITVGASSRTPGVRSELNLQTTISQRKPDS